MKIPSKKFSLVAFALVAVISARAEDSAVGKWKAQFDSQIGTQKYTYDFKMDGDKLVGHAIGERDTGTNDVAVTDLKVDKDKISFAEPLSIQGTDVKVEYSGTIAGDEMKLHRKVGDLAEYDIVAKRVKADAANNSIAGKWQGQFDSQIGVQKYTYDFKVDGDKLTGTAVGITEMGTNSSAITEGKILQDTVSFVEPLDFNGQEIRIDYTGKISADAIKFTRKVGDFATEELEVKRVK